MCIERAKTKRGSQVGEGEPEKEIGRERDNQLHTKRGSPTCNERERHMRRDGETLRLDMKTKRGPTRDSQVSDKRHRKGQVGKLMMIVSSICPTGNFQRPVTLGGAPAAAYVDTDGHKSLQANLWTPGLHKPSPGPECRHSLPGRARERI